MIKIFEYENSPIQFEVIDGHVMANATLMFKANNARLDKWKSLEATKRYLEACTRKWGTSENQLVTTRMGNPESGGGTWIHEKLILNAARYISVDFEFWCDEKIAELLRTGTVSIEEQRLAIASLYISNFKHAWQKTFFDNFYKQIYRLNGWPFTEESLRFKPGYVGKITNDYVYNMLPPGVSELLRRASNKAGKFHQFLTPEIGREHLKTQITVVTALMSAAYNWKHFQDLFMASNGQTALDFGFRPNVLNR